MAIGSGQRAPLPVDSDIDVEVIRLRAGIRTYLFLQRAVIMCSMFSSEIYSTIEPVSEIQAEVEYSFRFLRDVIGQRYKVFG